MTREMARGMLALALPALALSTVPGAPTTSATLQKPHESHKLQAAEARLLGLPETPPSREEMLPEIVSAVSATPDPSIYFYSAPLKSRIPSRTEYQQGRSST